MERSRRPVEARVGTAQCLLALGALQLLLPACHFKLEGAFDPFRCAPQCPDGKVCYQGQCMLVDGGAGDQGPADADESKPDLACDLTPDGQCSPTGSPTGCDPVQVTGCLAGSCYIIFNKGSSCVCPEGTVATGDPCNSTVECAPGNVCAGTAPPGTCRVTCGTAKPNCASSETCTPINGMPQWGFCLP